MALILMMTRYWMRPRTVDLPVLFIVASSEASAAIGPLFARRGFVTHAFEEPEGLDDPSVVGSKEPVAAIVDLQRTEGLRALAKLAGVSSKPVLVGIVDPKGNVAIQSLLDAAFARPVDPARLYTRVVSLVAAREQVKAARSSGSQAKIPGVVGVVEGNALFHRVAEELHAVIPPVNAGAVLERVLYEVGSSPFRLSQADLAAVIASGRLSEALVPFSDGTGIEFVLDRVRALLPRSTNT